VIKALQLLAQKQERLARRKKGEARSCREEGKRELERAREI